MPTKAWPKKKPKKVNKRKVLAAKTQLISPDKLKGRHTTGWFLLNEQFPIQPDIEVVKAGSYGRFVVLMNNDQHQLTVVFRRQDMVDLVDGTAWRGKEGPLPGFHSNEVRDYGNISTEPDEDDLSGWGI